MRPLEEWAARCISGTLGVEVVENDDGSADSMYDLRILYPDRAPGAVEVTAAADEQSIKLGKQVLEGGTWIVEGIVGGWHADLRLDANVKRLRAELPALLQALESQGVRRVDPESGDRGRHDAVVRSLGITHLVHLDTDRRGSVYLMPDQGADHTGGMVPTNGQPLIDWLVDWLARADKADNLAKLKASNSDERHLFLILPSFADAPFVVVYPLMSDDSPLPDGAPDLPPEITNVWALSTWNFSRTGVRWGPGSGWSRFDKALD